MIDPDMERRARANNTKGAWKRFLDVVLPLRKDGYPLGPGMHHGCSVNDAVELFDKHGEKSEEVATSFLRCFSNTEWLSRFPDFVFLPKDMRAKQMKYKFLNGFIDPDMEGSLD